MNSYLHRRIMMLGMSVVALGMFGGVALGQATFVSRDISGDLGDSSRSVMGDFDGDGNLDIFVSNFNEDNFLWINDGQGNFTPKIIPNSIINSDEIAMGDIDGDGDLDIYLTSGSSGVANVFLKNDGQANFSINTIPADGSLQNKNFSVDLGDIEGDGDLDMYLTTELGLQNILLINDGFGNFSTRNIPGDDAAFLNFGAELGDLDNDGDLEIYVVGLNNSNILYENLYDSTGQVDFVFRSIPANTSYSDSSVDVEMADIDGDGNLDIYVVNIGQNQILKNDGNLNFTVVTIPGDDKFTINAELGDLDNDGDLDIYNANYAVSNNAEDDEQNQIWINNGQMNFTSGDILNESDLGVSYDAVMGDVDGDGYLDIHVVSKSGMQNRLWINDASGNNGGNNNNTTVTTSRRGSFTRRTLEFVQDTLTPKPLEVATSLACPVIIEIPLSRDVSGGMDVKILQGMLNFKNNAGLVVDGVFGPLTQNAVMRYQSMNTFSTTGIVDMQTYQRLICNI